MSMPSAENEKKQLLLTVICPDGVPERITCDSLHITVKDGEKGTGGGMYGIRPGHAPAIFALAKGKAEALLDGKTVWKRELGEGFAQVGKNGVSLVAEPSVEKGERE